MSDRTGSPIDAITRQGGGQFDGESARRHNFEAVRSVANTIRSTLGPRGTDKMIEQPDGTVLITNDTATILDEVALESPVAALVVGIAEAVDKEIQDGTTTAVVLTDALLGEAEALIDRGVHPSAIIRGYSRANRRVRHELDDMAVDGEADADTLRLVAETAMTGKGLGVDLPALAELVVSAVDVVADEDGTVDTDHVRIVGQTGQPTAASDVIEGAVLTDDPVRESMPAGVEDARVLLTKAPVQLTDTKLDTTVDIEDAETFTRFLEQEDEQVRETVRHIADIDANAVLCSDSIADEAQSALSVDDILGVRRVDDDALAFAAGALGGTVVADLADSTAADLGHGRISRDDSDELFIVTGTGDPRATILLRGPTRQMVDELERHAETALAIVASARNGRLVAGGGAVEVELARRVRDRASGVSGREQLAMEAFADALETVPRVLAETVGLDPIDAVTALRNAHDAGGLWTGIDENGEVTDTFAEDIIEPAGVKRQAISSSTEAANLVLKIDDNFAVHELAIGE